MSCHRLVTGMNEADSAGGIGRLGPDPLPSGRQGLRLNVKSKDTAAGPHFPNQEQRIVAVAHGGVNGEPTGFQPCCHEGLGKV